MVANVAHPRANAPRMKPGMSNRARTGSELSGRTMAAATRATIPKIRLNQNTARQDHSPTSTPPMTGPMASASPDTAAQIPSARARRRRLGYRCRIMDSVPGSEHAAPIPMTTRPAIS